MTRPQVSIIGDFTAGQGLVAALIAVLMSVVAGYLGNEHYADAVLIASVPILGAIWVFRPLWPRPWFWVTIASIVAAHVAVFVLFPFGDALSGRRIVPVIAVDIIVVLATINLVAKAMMKKE